MINIIKRFYYRRVIKGLVKELCNATCIGHNEILRCELRVARSKLKSLL